MTQQVFQSIDRTPGEGYPERSGQVVTVLGLVDPDSYDSDDCGPMFHIRFADGTETRAFPEELEDDAQQAETQATESERPMSAKLTVGQIRKAIEGLPDDASVCPDWYDRVPDDHEPGVALFAAEADEQAGRPYLSIKVGLFYLDEDDGEDDTPLRIFYECPECDHEWEEEWTSACDSECPECGTTNISPVRYEDLTDPTI